MSRLTNNNAANGDVGDFLRANAVEISPDGGLHGLENDLPLLTNVDGAYRGGIGRPIAAITDDLLRLTVGWPKRAGDDLFVLGQSGGVRWLRDRPELIAWLHSITRLIWRNSGEGIVKEDVFLAHLRNTVECFDAVEMFPHFPSIPSIYYAHQPLPASDGSHFRHLIDRFSPATEADRSLIAALFLTIVWVGAAGARPAFLVTGLDGDSGGGRGIGKSALIEMAAHLVQSPFEVNPSDDINAVKKRLLSAEGRSQRVVRLDNVKSHRLSWADLESLITAPVISGHKMYVGEGQRPNLLTCGITLNGASLSRDLAQRVIIVKLRRCDHVAGWAEQTKAFIDAHRWQIFADMGAIHSSQGAIA